MFSTLKIYAGIAVTAAISILLAMLKYKSGKLEDTKEKLKLAKQELQSKKIEKEINQKIEKDYINKLNKIGEEYDIDEKNIYKMSDAPLSPSLLELLRRKQGSDSNTDTTPE